MRVAPLFILPFALLVSACAPKAQQVGGTPRSGPAPKIVSLSPSTTEIVALKLNSQMLIGRTASDNFPETVSHIPIVAGVKPDFEKIKMLAPTSVVYDADLYSPDDIKKIEGMGAKSFGFKATTVSDFEKELYELGNQFGSETMISGYVDAIEREVAGARGEGLKGSPKVAVVLGDGGYAAGTKSFVADVVKIAGGTPAGPDSTKFEVWSPESAVASAPDIIVVATDKASAAAKVAALKTNPRFASSPAVKNNKIAPLLEDVVTRRGARVDTFVRDLHRALSVLQGG